MRKVVMTPDCGALDGPIVAAARKALDARDVSVVLPFVPAEGEGQVRAMFERVLPMLELGPAARDTVDWLLCGTVVRLHRGGEARPYAALQPAGWSTGPVNPLAEQAVHDGSPDRLTEFLSAALHNELGQRLAAIGELAGQRDRSIEDARRYVNAMLDLEVYSHHLYEPLRSTDHHHS